MLGSIQVATIRGIPIRLHVTLLATLGVLVLLLGWRFGVPAAIALFGSVLLHELGHSVVAQAYGIRIAAIHLHVFGGMAMMTEPPKNPREELKIAAAGPLVSLAIAAILFGLLSLSSVVPHGLGDLLALGWRPFSGLARPTLVSLGAWAMAVNLGMFLFNLVPALPMDGGRILRALLATRLGALRATHIAAGVSRVIALVFIVEGLFTGTWSLPIIGVLLFVMVANEERVAEVQEALRQRAEQPFPFIPGMPGVHLRVEPLFPGFRGFARGEPPRPRSPYADGGPVIDVGAGSDAERPRETREEFVDRYGRRFVVITRVAT